MVFVGQLAVETAAVRVGAPDGDIRVLLVEHCRLNRHVEGLILRRSGFVVQEAATAGQALQMLHIGHYDAVLIDPDLPDARGLAILRRLRQLFKSGCLIVVSGRAFPAERQVALSAGCDAYIVKPINTHTFGEEVKSAVLARMKSSALAVTG